MPAGDTHALFRTAVVEVSAKGGVGGGTAEASAAGSPLATTDRDGRIADSSGAELLRAPIRFDGRKERGQNAVLDVAGPDGTPLGEVRVQRFTVTPRSRRATLKLGYGGADLALVEPQDKNAEESTITVAGRTVGTLHKTGKSGFIRSATTYRLELTGELDDRTRRLLVAMAIRYEALLTAVANASDRT